MSVADEQDPKEAAEAPAEKAPQKATKAKAKAAPKAETGQAEKAKAKESQAKETAAKETKAKEPAAKEAKAKEPAAEKPAAKARSQKKPPPKKLPRKPLRADEALAGRRSRRWRSPKAAAAELQSLRRRSTVRAHARYVRTSARKARMVCGHLRGKSVTEARAILAFTPRDVARDWSKLLESAVANAENTHELLEDDLVVREAYADEGPTIKRFRPRAMGRATPIRKRTSHLTITLSPRP